MSIGGIVKGYGMGGHQRNEPAAAKFRGRDCYFAGRWDGGRGDRVGACLASRGIDWEACPVEGIEWLDKHARPLLLHEC